MKLSGGYPITEDNAPPAPIGHHLYMKFKDPHGNWFAVLEVQKHPQSTLAPDARLDLQTAGGGAAPNIGQNSSSSVPQGSLQRPLLDHRHHPQYPKVAMQRPLLDPSCQLEVALQRPLLGHLHQPNLEIHSCFLEELHLTSLATQWEYLNQLHSSLLAFLMF